MRAKLWSLTLGNFAIGTGVLIMPGMLNELTHALGRSPAEIGVMFSAFAIVICVTGPLLAGWTSMLERRILLTAALALYAVTHLLSAIAPDYGSLMALRMVTALGAAVFTAQAAATAGLLVPAEERGRAIGLALLGWSIASVFGMPIGSYLGTQFGWRTAMAAEGLLSAACAAWLWMQIPSKLFVAPMNRAAWKNLFSNVPLLMVVAVTALQSTGQFTMYSYIVMVWQEYIRPSPVVISLLFAAFGTTGVIGNIIGTQLMDRIGTGRVAHAALILIGIALVLWPLTRNSLPFTVALGLLWGLGGFVINSAQQARLINLAPALSSASVAMNSSAMYLGQALGALVGGLLISMEGTARLSWAGALFIGAALSVSQLASILAYRRLPEKAA